jgi:hypothetical protein
MKKDKNRNLEKIECGKREPVLEQSLSTQLGKSDLTMSDNRNQKIIQSGQHLSV